MLGFPFGGAPAHGQMRESSRGSTTESARGGNRCDDAQNTCCTEIKCEKRENIFVEPIELKSYNDISCREKDVDNTKTSTTHDTIQPTTNSDDSLRGTTQCWRSILNKTDGTPKASPQKFAPVPPNSQVESPHPRVVNDPEIVRPVRDPIQLNPLAPPFCPQNRLGDAPVIRHDADYEMWRYATNDIRQNSTCLFGELTGYS